MFLHGTIYLTGLIVFRLVHYSVSNKVYKLDYRSGACAHDYVAVTVPLSSTSNRKTPVLFSVINERALL